MRYNLSRQQTYTKWHLKQALQYAKQATNIITDKTRNVCHSLFIQLLILLPFFIVDLVDIFLLRFSQFFLISIFFSFGDSPSRTRQCSRRQNVILQFTSNNRTAPNRVGIWLKQRHYPPHSQSLPESIWRQAFLGCTECFAGLAAYCHSQAEWYFRLFTSLLTIHTGARSHRARM